MIKMRTENGKSLNRIHVKNNIISCLPVHVPEVAGLGSTLFWGMKRNKHAVAQIDGITGQKDPFPDYLQRCIRTAITMRSRGITSEDIVSICSLNHLNTTVPYIAALFLNAKLACLDPTLSLNVTSHILKQICPKIIFVGPECVNLIEDAIKESGVNTQIVVFGNSNTHSQFSEFLEVSTEENNFVPVETRDVKETALILFSSGTTGFPKGICLSHHALLGKFATSRMSLDISVSLSFASIYWISAALLLFCTVIGGCTRVITPRFDANEVWRLIDRFKVTSIFVVPTQLLFMCRNGVPKGIDKSSLSYVFGGGSAMSKDKFLEVRDVLKGTTVTNNYGLTESAGLVLALDYINDPLDMKVLLENPHTLGRPISGIIYKVVNPETEEVVGPNRPGELRIKTEFQMNGYYKLDSSNAWDASGFLKTGDIVYYDRDYSFYFIDRIKEMLHYRTHQVVPTKLESILLSHPSIECAVVFGLPHSEDGDHPTAVVMLRKSAFGEVSEEDIQNYVAERVNDFEKLKGGVRFSTTIHITPTGKLSRRRMKDLVMRGII